MGSTFRGTWNRPNDPQRGRTHRQIADQVSYDNQPSDDCLSSLFFLTILATTCVAALRRRK